MEKILNASFEELNGSAELMTHFLLILSERGIKVAPDCKQLKKYHNELKQSAMSKEQKFKLKPNSRITNFGTGESWTTATMTDEAALRLLKQNASRINLFKTFPKDWKKMIGKSATAPEIVEIIDKAIAKDQIEEFYGDKRVTVKAALEAAEVRFAKDTQDDEK